jgi:RNA polymerase sigma-70 factor (ECF subfamily)
MELSLERLTPALPPIFQEKRSFSLSFFARLKDRPGAGGIREVLNPPQPNPGTSLLTRPTLLYRVREWEDSASWEEFHRLYRRLVYGRARRAGLSHADAEDVAQDVFARVAKAIKDFEYDAQRGAFRGWLMQLTHWRIADKFESRAKSPAQPNAPASDATSTGTGPIDRLAAPEQEEDEWDREWQQHILAAAIDRLRRKVKPKHFQVFELYVRQQWPVLKVSAELGVNPASVYLIGHRLTKQLKLEAENLQGQLG